MIRITSTGIVDGQIERRFGKFGEEKLQGVPTRSLPLQWSGVPHDAQSLVIMMHDHDAVPICGFSWIHWLVADIDPRCSELLENASRADPSLVQGKNSLASKQVCGELSDEVSNYYGGPRPPDKAHEYEIRIIALDRRLDLKTGFRFSELVRAMRGHVLDEGTLIGTYPSFE